MPRAIAKEKLELIAVNYIANDYDPVKALVETGYNKKYAQNNHKSIFENVELQGIIKQKRAKLEIKAEHNRDIALQKLAIAEEIAIEQRNPTAIVAAIREMDAITGLHSQTIINHGQVQPQDMDDETRQLLKEHARLATSSKARQNIKINKTG